VFTGPKASVDIAGGDRRGIKRAIVNPFVAKYSFISNYACKSHLNFSLVMVANPVT
jgi:hypothetical protein